MTNSDNAFSTQSSTPDDVLTMVLVGKGDDALLAIASEPDREKRSLRLQEHLQACRKTMVDLIERHAHRGIRIVNSMEGSPSIVATGSSAAWAALSAEEASALEDIDLVSNDPVWRLPAEEA